MALETVNFTLDETAWVQIGSSVTGLSITEFKVGNLKMHVVMAGGAAPVSLDAPFQEWNNDQTYTGSAADIYAWSPHGSAVVGVVRE